MVLLASDQTSSMLISAMYSGGIEMPIKIGKTTRKKTIKHPDAYTVKAFLCNTVISDVSICMDIGMYIIFRLKSYSRVPPQSFAKRKFVA